MPHCRFINNGTLIVNLLSPPPAGSPAPGFLVLTNPLTVDMVLGEQLPQA